MMMTVPLYTHNPTKFRFLQAVSGIQMWRCGASNKVSVCYVLLLMIYTTATSNFQPNYWKNKSSNAVPHWTLFGQIFLNEVNDAVFWSDAVFLAHL